MTSPVHFKKPFPDKIGGRCDVWKNVSKQEMDNLVN